MNLRAESEQRAGFPARATELTPFCAAVGGRAAAGCCSCKMGPLSGESALSPIDKESA